MVAIRIKGMNSAGASNAGCLTAGESRNATLNSWSYSVIEASIFCEAFHYACGQTSYDALRERATCSGTCLAKLIMAHDADLACLPGHTSCYLYICVRTRTKGRLSAELGSQETSSLSHSI